MLNLDMFSFVFLKSTLKHKNLGEWGKLLYKESLFIIMTI